MLLCLQHARLAIEPARRVITDDYGLGGLLGPGLFCYHVRRPIVTVGAGNHEIWEEQGGIRAGEGQQGISFIAEKFPGGKVCVRETDRRTEADGEKRILGF